jgi:hypothetical protein
MALSAFPVLAPRLRSIAYPDNFKPNIQKYDGRSDPNIWLSTYYVAIKAVSGNFDHMVAYFPLVMGNTPPLWLNNLPAGSITLWADLSQAFTSNFQAMYNRPGNAFNLGRVTMKPGELLRDYTNRFFENRNTCVGVRDDQVVDNYKKGLRDSKVYEKIHESGATMVAPLMEVVNKLIDTKEALVNQFDHEGKQDAGTPGAAGDTGSKFHKRSSEVLATDGSRPSTFNVEEFNTVLDDPCTFHEWVLTRFASASSSRGRSARPRTPSDLEATEIGHPHVATTTTAATTDVADQTMSATTIGDVMTTRQRIVARSATCLPRRRQATPMVHSNMPRGRST